MKFWYLIELQENKSSGLVWLQVLSICLQRFRVLIPIVVQKKTTKPNTYNEFGCSNPNGS